jgi:hypothetical protein
VRENHVDLPDRDARHWRARPTAVTIVAEAGALAYPAAAAKAATEPPTAKEAEMLARTHTPELRRNEILRALSDAHLPELHLPEIDLREAVSKLEIPTADEARTQIGAAMAQAGKSIGIGRPTERQRWPLAAVGLVIAAAAGAAIAGWALLRDKALREPLARANHSARMAIAGARSSLRRRLGGERMDLIAIDVAAPAPAEIVPAAEAAKAAETLEAAPAKELAFVESGEPC